jgi:muramoyltetrapeptide carboxypeptidase LdcA involved in peptidoglycan recycling
MCYGTTFPILFNVDIGHTDPILTIPMNAEVRLDSEGDEFVVLEAGVDEG